MDATWLVSQQFFDTSIENKMTVPMTSDYIYGYNSKEKLGNSDYVDESTGDNLPSSQKASMDAKETFQVMIGSPNGTYPDDIVVKWPPIPENMAKN